MSKYEDSVDALVYGYKEYQRIQKLEPEVVAYCEADVKATYELYKSMKKYKRKQVIKKILYYFAAFLVAAVLFWLMLKGV
jgi:hypothetical protein